MIGIFIRGTIKGRDVFSRVLGLNKVAALAVWRLGWM